MSNITATAQSFFDACETGKAWAGCQQYCTPNATFSSQANPLLNISTLSAYCDWMRDVLTGLTDVSYEVKSFATDTKEAKPALAQNGPTTDCTRHPVADDTAGLSTMAHLDNSLEA